MVLAADRVVKMHLEYGPAHRLWNAHKVEDINETYINESARLDVEEASWSVTCNLFLSASMNV